jgi:hypothetical protein
MTSIQTGSTGRADLRHPLSLLAGGSLTPPRVATQLRKPEVRERQMIENIEFDLR